MRREAPILRAANIAPVLPGAREAGYASTASSVGGECWGTARSQNRLQRQILVNDERKLESEFRNLSYPANAPANLRI